MFRDHDRGLPGAQYAEAGEWLREQRRYWQITQAELAEQAGIAEVALIDAIETGRVALPHSMQNAVARTFGIAEGDLAGLCEDWYGRAYAEAA